MPGGECSKANSGHVRWRVTPVDPNGGNACYRIVVDAGRTCDLTARATDRSTSIEATVCGRPPVGFRVLARSAGSAEIRSVRLAMGLASVTSLLFSSMSWVVAWTLLVCTVYAERRGSSVGHRASWVVAWVAGSDLPIGCNMEAMG